AASGAPVAFALVRRLLRPGAARPRAGGRAACGVGLLGFDLVLQGAHGVFGGGRAGPDPTHGHGRLGLGHGIHPAGAWPTRASSSSTRWRTSRAATRPRAERVTPCPAASASR